jgi:phosphotransferase system HPr (HPr) family protein
MLNARLTVINELGLHARAAANLVRDVSPFQSNITLIRADISRSADAKSILSLLTLAATKGTVLEIVVDGPDENLALVALQGAFEGGFGSNDIQE